MPKKVRLIGIPLDLGQVHRGVNMGPSAVRYAGLAKRLRHIGYTVNDIGNINVPIREKLLEGVYENVLPALQEASLWIYNAAKQAVEDECIPIFMGGDHSIAIGTIGGITSDTRCGVIWIDAHGDFNTPATSKSGNIHGMPLSILLGDGHEELVNIGRPGAKLRPEDVVLIGLRDLDKEERNLIKQSGVHYFTMRDIDEKGISRVMQEVLKCLDHLDKIHISFDVDSLDPIEAPGVGTPVKGGLSYREAHLAMEIIADSGKVCSMDIVEINPMLDMYNNTDDMAVELTASLFGKSII
ncbi:MAG: arginase [Denitrovibrio sp.]|nr:MAG: arginase [Denitrovibrio sp.]